VAARLSDADPELSVLVVEAGADNYQDPTVVHPVLFTAHLAPTSTRMVFHRGAKSAATAQRDMVVPCGSVLGGGSSVNMMMYSRPQRADLDAWATPGWTADDLLPYLKKVRGFFFVLDSSLRSISGFLL
jgi:choline dehydrogenase-like flavoprotein